MFKSFIEDLQCKILTVYDSDFDPIIFHNYISVTRTIDLACYVEKIYRNKNLNVIKNLILFQIFTEETEFYTFDLFLNDMKRNPILRIYYDDIKKYSTLK